MTEGDKSGVFKKVILQELKSIRDGEILEPQVDWNLVWVLSGPQKTFDLDDKDIGGHGNETRDRLISGFRLVKEITAVRLGKMSSEVTLKDILAHGPKIYFNGWNDQNDNIRKMRDRGLFEKDFDIPREIFTIAGHEGIDKTPDQFRKFPEDLAKGEGKIVLITDAYHVPQTTRIAKRREIDGSLNPIPFDRLVIYPSLPFKFPLEKTRSEIGKMPGLIEKGFLPSEK